MQKNHFRFGNQQLARERSALQENHARHRPGAKNLVTDGDQSQKTATNRRHNAEVNQNSASGTTHRQLLQNTWHPQLNNNEHLLTEAVLQKDMHAHTHTHTHRQHKTTPMMHTYDLRNGRLCTSTKHVIRLFDKHSESTPWKPWILYYLVKRPPYYHSHITQPRYPACINGGHFLSKQPPSIGATTSFQNSVKYYTINTR